jgi:rare lipoprotein A
MKLLILIFWGLIIGPFLGYHEVFTGNTFQSLYKAKGKASYYADKFNGRKTSSGEKFSNDSLTAAHKFLPFGTLINVTNQKNDSTIVVKINDRLPKKSSRIIDLSKAAARKLNFIKSGITLVSLEEIAKH